jgi:hypothetical protein
MPRMLSTAAAAAALARETAEVFVTCLRITGSGLTTLRIANDSVAVVRTAGTYQPCAFEAVLPEDGADWNGTISVRIDNVDRTIGRLIRNYEGIATCRLEVVLASSPNTVELGPFDFSVLSADLDETAVVLTLGYAEGFLDQAVPAQAYTPSNSPGLFV